MTMTVLDASATLAWLFEEVNGAPLLKKHLEDTAFIAPPVWRLEVLNALLTRERQGRISQLESTDFLEAVRLLAVTVQPDEQFADLAEFASFARPHQLTAYDASYLSLAYELKLPLMTLDNNLRLAAGKLGVTLSD